MSHDDFLCIIILLVPRGLHVCGRFSQAKPPHGQLRLKYQCKDDAASTLSVIWCFATQGMEGMDEEDLTEEQRALLRAIRARKAVVLARHRLKKGTANNQAVLPRRADAGRTINTRTMKVRYASCCLNATKGVTGRTHACGTRHDPARSAPAGLHVPLSIQS